MPNIQDYGICESCKDTEIAILFQEMHGLVRITDRLVSDGKETGILVDIDWHERFWLDPSELRKMEDDGSFQLSINFRNTLYSVHEKANIEIDRAVHYRHNKIYLKYELAKLDTNGNVIGQKVIDIPLGKLGADGEFPPANTDENVQKEHSPTSKIPN